MTVITAKTGTTRLARAGGQARGICVPLLIAGTLAAGCGTVTAPASGRSGAATSSAPPVTVSGTPAASATPVPTVTGGAVTAGEPACVGWPSDAPHGTLTAFFGAVAVERCVTGYQTGPGHVLWQTATLEKATRNIAPLVDALLQPSARQRPGTVCPYLAIIPPQVVLISASGKQLIPRIPLSDCGQVQSQFLTALATLTWQPISVRLIAKVSGTQPGTATVSPRSPKTFQTLPAA